MARVKSSVQTRRRRKKILKAAKGYFGAKHKLYKTAKEQVMHSLVYAYRDRRRRKRDFRKLWITRISAGCRLHNITYSRFINGLKLAKINLNRKIISEMAIHDKQAFIKIVEIAKKAIVS